MKKYKISAVSYYNTLPFIYGIENSEFIKKNSVIERHYPSLCAAKLTENIVDIGLVPVASLLNIENYQIITDFCIGTKGKVDTVVLVSNVQLEEISKIILDYQSITSINLVKILAKHFWKIKPEWINAEEGYETKIKNNEGGIIIGDRAFSVKENYKYCYDLGEEWKKYTNLPFVFAVWASNKSIDKEYIKQLNKAFKYGYDNIDKVVLNSTDKISITTVKLKRYLTESLDFNLDESKKRGMNLFLKLLSDDKKTI